MKRIIGCFMVFTLVMALSSVSAQDGSESQNITIGGKYAIQLPAYMAKTTSLNSIASLQYNDTTKELYVIVIDETFKSLEAANLKLNLSIYFKMACFNIATGLKDFNISNISNKTRGNLKIMEAEFSGFLASNNVGIYYKVAVIQSPTQFYQIFTWTLKNQQEQYQELLQKIIDSFREL